MSEEVEFDGEIHALDKDYGYIAIKVTEEGEVHSGENGVLTPVLQKYAEYVLDNDREKSLQIIKKDISLQRFAYDDDYTIVYRPPCADYELYGTFCIKFKRKPNDGLD